MAPYIVKRVVLLVPTLAGITVLTFALIHFIPGDLVTILLGVTASQNEINRRAIIEALHLDQPLAVQYLLWVRGVLGGDFGRSLVTGLSVKAELLRSFPVTLELTLLTMVIALLLGVPMGILSATRMGGVVDLLTRTGSLLFISAPAFFIGTVLIVVGARYAPWYPVLQYVPFSQGPTRSLLSILPAALALGAAVSAILLRFTRSSLLEVMGQEYIRTARAKGVSERRVIYRHALKNALIPVLAAAGIQFVYLIGGAVVIEEVFALPGVGRLVVNAIHQRDYTMIQGAVLVLTVAAVIINLLLDLAYHLIDPRIIYG